MCRKVLVGGVMLLLSSTAWAEPLVSQAEAGGLAPELGSLVAIGAIALGLARQKKDWR